MLNKYTKDINKDRYKSVSEYIKTKYNLAGLLTELGVWDGGTRVIACPFHPDSRPSFNINVEDNFFKCFSCGSYGGYLSFYHKYYSIVKEDNKSFYDHVEEILASDIDMQESLGFSTIFVKLENRVSLIDLSSYQRPVYKLKIVDIRCLETIRKVIEKEDVSLLLDFFADIERGRTLDDLWNKYINKSSVEDVILSKEDSDEIKNEFQSLLAETFEDESFLDDDSDSNLTNLFKEE